MTKDLCTEVIMTVLASVGREMSDSGEHVCVYLYVPHGKLALNLGGKKCYLVDCVN